MMEILSAILLGLVQGLTEFLPVSSSGHLELAKVILGQTGPEEGLMLTIVLHTATALSTLIVFRKDIGEILTGLLVKKSNSWLFTLHIIISMIPAAFIGLFFEEKIATLFDGNLFLVGGALLATGFLLHLADRPVSTKKVLNPQNAFWIGIAQAIAILPGVSRSGATIASAVLLGISRENAARFSFLMVIPLIFGSLLKSVLDAESTAITVDLLPLTLGFTTALLTGIFACRWMIALVKNSQLKYFAYYCFVVGSLALLYGFIG